MFAKAVDFKKHMKCADDMKQLIEKQPNETLEILDLLFKWGNLRMAESSNTQLLMAIFNLYDDLLKFLNDNQTKLAEFEATLLIGTLCDKTGLNIKPMQEKARALLK